MQIALDVNETTRVEEANKRSRALSGGVRDIGNGAVQRMVKDGIEVPTENRRRRGINVIRDEIKELLSCRVTIKSVQRNHTKGLVTKNKFTAKTDRHHRPMSRQETTPDDKGQDNHKTYWNQETPQNQRKEISCDPPHQHQQQQPSLLN